MANDLDFMDDFDPKAAAEEGGNGDFAPIPAGWYYGRITEAEVQLTKAGNGKMVYCRIDIEGPSHAGRVVFDRMIVKHPNPDAMSIGRARFGNLCLGAGFPKKPDDTRELIGKTVGVKLKTEASKQYGDKSVPQTYKSMSDSGAVSAPSSDASKDKFNDDDIPF